MTIEVAGARRSVAELLRAVRNGEAEMLETGSFRLVTGELFTALGRPTRHGHSGFTNHGCRCDECRGGNRDWHRAYRARIQAIPTPDPWANIRGIPLHNEQEAS